MYRSEAIYSDIVHGTMNYIYIYKQCLFIAWNMVESVIKQYDPNPLLTITFMYSVPTRYKAYSTQYTFL